MLNSFFLEIMQILKLRDSGITRDTTASKLSIKLCYVKINQLFCFPQGQCKVFEQIPLFYVYKWNVNS